MGEAMDFPASLARVEASMQRPGIANHLAAVASWVSQAEGELAMDELKPLLRILIEAVPRLYDPLSRRQAEHLFVAVLGRGGKTCYEGSLAMLMQCSKKVSSATALALLFSWACHLARIAALPEGGILQGPAFPKLVSLQCQLLACVAKEGKKKLTASCVAKAHALFKRFNGALDMYMAAASETKDEAEIEGAMLMFASFFGRQARATDAAFAPVKDALLKAYKTGVLDATQGGRKIASSTAMAFGDLMHWVNHDEFALLMPEIVRVLRRTPEYLIDSLTLTLTHLTIDTSRYVEAFIEILCERVLEEGFHDSVIKLVSALARQSSDVSALLPLGSALIKTLSSKAKSWQDRVAICRALDATLTCVKAKGIAPLAEEVLASLTAATDKEPKEEVKCCALALVGVCCLRAEKCGPDVLKLMTKCLEAGSDAVRRAALQANQN